MRRYGSIYLIENRVSGDCYIGQTIQTVARRWQAHVNSARNNRFKLSTAISEFGKDVFSVVEIFIAFDKQALDEAERMFIAAINPKYNATKGGAGRPSIVVSEAERVKRSMLSKAMWADPEQRQRLQAALFSPTTNLLRNLGVKRACSNEATKQKKRQAMLGRKMNRSAIEKSAKAKHKAIRCVELGIEFEAMKAAADYFSVRRSTISEAVRLGRMISGMYTLERI